MKLIVLKGKPNTGKTTTLKMVYEMLKEINVEETHCFKYYDSDHDYNDFRDVLVIKKKENESKSPYVELKTIDDLKQYFPEYSKYFDTFESIGKEVKDLEEKNRIQFQLYSLEDNVTSNICLDLTKIDGNDLETIGLVLEGDYGFVHSKDSCWSEHSRNLYENLKQLINCDTIICACSEPSLRRIKKENEKLKFQPYFCLFCFIAYCIKSTFAPIQIIELETIKKENQDEGEKKKRISKEEQKKIQQTFLEEDMVLANQILNLIIKSK